MANALSDLSLPQADPDFLTGGEDGDGDDLWGVAAYCEPQEPLTGIWDDPEPLAALLAQEEQAELNAAANELVADVEILDEEGYAEPSYEELGLGEDDLRPAIIKWLDQGTTAEPSLEYDTGWLNREPPAWYTWADLLADENTGCDWDGGLVTDPIVPGEDDTRQGGTIGLGRLAHTELGYFGGAGFHKDSTDKFRRHRQAVKRPRRDAAKAKEAMHTAIAA